MAQMSVGSTPVEVTGLGRGVAIIQNLGPGAIYMDSSESVTAEGGFKIEEGGVYETLGSGGNSTIFLVSEGTSAVRVVSI